MQPRPIGPSEKGPIRRFELMDALCRASRRLQMPKICPDPDPDRRKVAVRAAIGYDRPARRGISTMPSLDHVNIQTLKLGETVAFYRDVLELRAGDPPPPLDPALIQWMFDAEGRAIFHLSSPGA